jgi:leader peptidase (prepilin peptidase) / N-methyltransferase
VHIALSVLIGLVAGPFIHQIAVQAGADRPFSSRDCRECGAPISLVGTCPACGRGPVRVWITTLVAAGLAGGTAAVFGWRWILPAYLFFAGMTIALFITDIDHKRIPNRITYPGTLIGALLLTAGAALDGQAGLLPRAFLGGLAYTAFFALVYLVARGGFGFGDVKLAVSLGLFTTFLGWDRLFLAGMATAAAGGVLALAAVVFARAGANSEIPYGPPMIIGTWVAILWGSSLAGLLL